MHRSACSLVLAIGVFALANIPPVAAQQTGTQPAGEDCATITQQVRDLQDALSQLSVERQALANALDRINNDIATLQQGVKFFSGPGSSESARGEALDKLATAMSQRQQVEKDLEDVDSLVQATKDAIADLLSKLANCAPPSTTQPNQASPLPQGPPGSIPTSPPPPLQAAEDCAAITQQIRDLQDALSQLLS